MRGMLSQCGRFIVFVYMGYERIGRVDTIMTRETGNEPIICTSGGRGLCIICSETTYKLYNSSAVLRTLEGIRDEKSGDNGGAPAYPVLFCSVQSTPNFSNSCSCDSRKVHRSATT